MCKRKQCQKLCIARLQKSDIQVRNSYESCAERNLIQIIEREARVKGVKPHAVDAYIKRKYGTFVVKRFRDNGELTTSLPCCWCRKEMERRGIRWVAQVGNCIVNNENAPCSRNTKGQKIKWKHIPM